MSEPRKPFSLEQSLSWGDVLSAAVLLTTGLMAFTAVQTRVALNEERISAIGAGTSSMHTELQVHIEREDKAREAMRAEMKNDLRQISEELRDDFSSVNEKLDRLIERDIQRGR